MKHLVSHYNQIIDWHWLPDIVHQVIERAIDVQQIPAPTFAEGPRADYVADQFRQYGLLDIDIDEVFNVYGRLPGQNPNAPAVMVSAHIDTVFPAATDLSVRREKAVIHGPGLGDNSVGVAGMLGLAHALTQGALRKPDRDIWFVATSREEGLGDLGGMRAAYARLHDQIDSVINVEGLAFGHIYHAGIAVRRLHIVANAPGGHSWLHFGRASAIHELIRLGGRIIQLDPSHDPRTTYNIGMIEGGHSINSIATQAGLWLDMRSEDPQHLATLERTIRTQIELQTKGDVHFEVEIVGDRPAGYLQPDHPLVEAAMHTLKLLGINGTLETGSTDGNIPLSAGCPAITIGITRGGNAHRLDEYIETRAIKSGMRQLALISLVAAHDHQG